MFIVAKMPPDDGRHLLFPGLFAPTVMVGDVVDHFRNGHFSVSELNMGFGVVSGGEVDLGGAFVV